MSAQRYLRTDRNCGLTMIELLITIAVLTILTAIALPTLSGVMGSYRADAAAQEIKAGLDFARSEAIKRSTTSQICTSSNGGTCTSGSLNWASGWLIWTDADGDTILDSDEITQVAGAISSSLTFNSTVGAITFQSLGQVLATGTSISFTVTHTSSGVRRHVCVSSAGSSKVQTADCQ